MNKTTRPLDIDEYRNALEAISEGFTYTDTDGRQHKFRRNPQLAMVCQIQANMGLRISDLLNLKMNSIKKDGGRYALDIVEQKTGKHRGFTVPAELYESICNYALENGIKKTERLFPITERAAQKQLKIVGEYLGIDELSTHSFRKTFARSAYEDNGMDIELVRELLQHSSITTTQRYLGCSSKKIEAALKNTTKRFLII